MDKMKISLILHPIFIALSVLAISLSISIIPAVITHDKHISKYFQDFRFNVGQLAATLATVVDGDLHKKIRNNSQLNDDDYKKVILPLVKFHNANPNIFYVYTMIEKDGKVFYILDTMSDSRLNLGRPALENTEIMEEVEVEEENQDDWIKVQKEGKTYVTPKFERDNYGTFLSGHAPFYDSNGLLEGFVGIDYDTKSYQNSIAKYQKDFYISLIWSIIFSLLVTMLITFLVFNLKKVYLKIDSLSKYDHLTGLFNRFTFKTLIENDLKKIQRTKESLFFIIIDIDDFKEINDSFGHQIGDTAIKKVSQLLKKELRESDTIARFGGDEFLIYITDYDDLAASKLIRRLEELFSKTTIDIENEVSLKLSISIGYTKNKEGCNYESLLDRADRALYISKETGKGIGTFMS